MPAIGELRQLAPEGAGLVRVYVLLWTRGYLEGWEDVETGELRILSPAARERLDRGPVGGAG